MARPSGGCSIRHICPSCYFLIFIFFLSLPFAHAIVYTSDLRFWQSVQPSPGTLLLLRFDAQNIKDAEALVDSSPDHNSVTSEGSVEITAEGRFGSALKVNGGSLRAVLKRPLAFEISWLSSSPQLAGDAWIYLDQYPEKEGVFIWRSYIAEKQNGWSLSVDHDGALIMRWRRCKDNRLEKEVRTPPGAVPLRAWTHAAGILRYGHHAGVFINGDEKGSLSYTDLWGVNDGLAVEQEGGTVTIGNDAQGKAPFPGRLDELRISSNMLYLFPKPDNSWCDTEAKHSPKIGPPYTPGEEDLLLYDSFDKPDGSVDVSPRNPGLKPTFNPKYPEKSISGVRGKGMAGEFSFDQKYVLNRERGAIEFWFYPINWTNTQVYHYGIMNGPFIFYILNTGVVAPPYVPLVTWFQDKTYIPFNGVFSPEHWRHLVVCWDGQEITGYVDGERAAQGRINGGSFDKIAGPWPVVFYGQNNCYDELYIYNRPLTPEEVRNCYLRYRSPEKMKPVPKISAEINYLQGSDALLFTITRIQQTEVARCALELTERTSKKRFYERIEPLPKLGTSLVKSLPHLPDGQYLLTARFQKKTGLCMETLTKEFGIHHFPWEKNNLGKDPIILPPYEPIVIETNKLKPWGRTISIGKNGLPESIVSAGEELLSAPISLIAACSGSDQPFIGEKVTIQDIPGFKVLNREDYLCAPLTGTIPPMKLQKSRGYQAQVSATGKLGSLNAKVSGVLDIDGWYQVRVTLSPRAKETATLDSLDLHINLASNADTLYAQIEDTSQDPNGYVNSSGEFGCVPKQVGESWSSLKLAKSAKWKSFVPQVYVGTGERGLWWLAESKEGWNIKDGVPCVTIRREQNRVSLVLRILGEKTLISEPRTFEFALLPSPVKPMERKWRELGWGWGEKSKDYYTHDTCGYRYWGDSVDSFALHTDEDYAHLTAFLQDPPKQNPYYYWYTNYSNGIKDKVPHVLYGSTWMFGGGMPELRYYGREWLGDENWKPSPDYRFEGVTDYSNSYRWTTPEQLTATGGNNNSSFMDCFLWYHKRLLEKCPVNGTWWDNSSIGLITEFPPGREPLELWNTFKRRELTRRLAVIGYQIGRRPWWIMNMHVDFSWCQVAWHIENDFYIQVGKDLIEQLGIDKFRSLCCTKGGIIHRLHSSIPSSFTEQEKILARRTIVGLALLHDIGEVGLQRWFKDDRDVLDKTIGVLEKEVQFFSGNPTFLPYWRQRALPLPDKVYASFFLGEKKSAAIIVNASDAPVALDSLDLNTKALGLSQAERVVNAETGEVITSAKIGRHDFALLIFQ